MALLAFSCASFADTAPDVSRADRGPITRAYGSKIAERVFSNELAGLRTEALQKSGRSIPGYDCKGDRLSALIEALPYPTTPKAISWVERYLVDCEPRTRRNLMLFLEDEKSRSIELLPGETKADPRLQRDAIRLVKIAATPANPPSCEKSWVTDTREIDPYKDGNTPWSERWKLDLCGKSAEVDMLFTPSAGAGTNIATTLVK